MMLMIGLELEAYTTPTVYCPPFEILGPSNATALFCSSCPVPAPRFCSVAYKNAPRRLWIASQLLQPGNTAHGHRLCRGQKPKGGTRPGRSSPLPLWPATDLVGSILDYLD